MSFVLVCKYGGFVPPGGGVVTHYSPSRCHDWTERLAKDWINYRVKHEISRILWLFTTEEDKLTLHLELVLQCFNSLHLDERSTTEDTLRVNLKALVDDNNNIELV